jgi:hypothetical protein
MLRRSMNPSPADSIAGASSGAVTGQTTRRMIGPIIGPIIGIDVGEDFLDLAMLDGAANTLRLARVAVSGADRGEIVEDDVPLAAVPKDRGVIDELARRLSVAAPELGAEGAMVLIDSPRWPRDLDLASHAAGTVAPPGSARASSARAIDTSLRAMVRELALQNRDGTPFRLSMFPTPKFEFFSACARDPRCKPHLAAIARELFGAALESAQATPAPAGGRIFTRFMLAGFAVYRALERTSAALYEAYPDLAFRLWAHGEKIPPKGARRDALDARRRINCSLADELGCCGAANIATLDQADATILALSAARASRHAAIVVIEHPAEGRFALALDCDQVDRV